MAGAGDVPALASLREDWSRQRFDGCEPDFPVRFARWWDRQGGARVAWLATVGERPTGERPVGMANAAVFERMPHAGLPDARWCYVGNVWVDPAHRRRGVGTALMAEAIAWARRERMERMVLNPSEMSVGMYRALGFRPAADLLRLDL